MLEILMIVGFIALLLAAHYVDAAYLIKRSSDTRSKALNREPHTLDVTEIEYRKNRR